MRRALLSSVVLVLALVGHFGGGCRARDGSAGLTVSAAASLTDVMYDLTRAYGARRPDVRITMNLASSSRLARQITRGAPVDVFVSADPAQMDLLSEAGSVARRWELLSNRLVAVCPAGSATEAGSFAEALGLSHGRIAIGADAVPAGEYARDYLGRAGLRDATAGRLVPMATVRHVLAAVESGNAEIGFVYATDVAVASGRVRVLETFTEEETGPISYHVAVLEDARNPDEAAAFVEWLRGDEAAAIFSRAGFVRAGSAPSSRSPEREAGAGTT